MRLFDTHAHYDSGAFNADRLELLASMPEQGVELILNPGCELESSKAAVELAEPEAVYEKSPHQLSGGMLQRAMIAAAVIAKPKLLILDEPTTALDVTIQAQILELLKKLNRESGVSMLFISHDLNVVRKLCGRVAVMQKGQLVEEGEAQEVFRHPKHPYSQRLIAAIPTRKRKEAEP